MRRAGVTHRHGQQRAQHAPAVHREGRDEVEQHQRNVHRRELGEHLDAGPLQVLEVFELRVAAQDEDEHHRDHHVDQRAGDGHNQLLPRLVGHPLKACHPANRQQRDVRCVDAKGARGQGVAELVQQHAAEQGENEEHAFGGRGRAADFVVGETNPRQEQKEGDVDADLDAGDSRDFDGPAHKRVAGFRRLLLLLDRERSVRRTRRGIGFHSRVFFTVFMARAASPS